MAKNDGKNAEAVGDLKRRLTMAYIILFGSIAAIPCGFLCPCGLALAVAESSSGLAAGLAIASLLFPFVGLAGLLLMTGDRSKYKRGLAVAEVAEAFNFKYTYQPKRKKHLFLNSFRLLADPDNEFASHLMTGKLDGIPVTALDYSHAYGIGTAASVYRASVVVLTEGFNAVPPFVLYPRGWLDKLGDLIMGRPLKFSASKAFNKTFALVSDEIAAIESLFSDDLVKLCLKEPNLMLEVRQGKLLAYQYETVLDTAAYEEFLELVGRIAGQMLNETEEEDEDEE